MPVGDLAPLWGSLPCAYIDGAPRVRPATSTGNSLPCLGTLPRGNPREGLARTWHKPLSRGGPGSAGASPSRPAGPERPLAPPCPEHKQTPRSGAERSGSHHFGAGGAQQAAGSPSPSLPASSRRGRAGLSPRRGRGARSPARPRGCSPGSAGRGERRSQGGPCDKAQCAGSW